MRRTSQLLSAKSPTILSTIFVSFSRGAVLKKKLQPPLSKALCWRASAASADEVALYKLGGKYAFAFGSSVPEGASIVALATHCVPFIGKFISSVTNMWIVYACSALAAILIILIIRLAAFSAPDESVTDGVKSKKSCK